MLRNTADVCVCMAIFCVVISLIMAEYGKVKFNFSKKSINELKVLGCSMFALFMIGSIYFSIIESNSTYQITVCNSDGEITYQGDFDSLDRTDIFTYSNQSGGDSVYIESSFTHWRNIFIWQQNSNLKRVAFLLLYFISYLFIFIYCFPKK